MRGWGSRRSWMLWRRMGRAAALFVTGMQPLPRVAGRVRTGCHGSVDPLVSGGGRGRAEIVDAEAWCRPGSNDVVEGLREGEQWHRRGPDRRRG